MMAEVPMKIHLKGLVWETDTRLDRLGKQRTAFITLGLRTDRSYCSAQVQYPPVHKATCFISLLAIQVHIYLHIYIYIYI